MAKKPSARDIASTEKPPTVIAAVVCEKVLHEVDRTISAIRIIDRITIGVPVAPGQSLPNPPPTAPIRFSFLLMLKAGEATGEQIIRVITLSPSGKPIGDDVLFMPNLSLEDAANLIVVSEILVSEAGVYEVEVRWSKRLLRLVRTPFLVHYEPVTQPEPSL